MRENSNAIKIRYTGNSLTNLIIELFKSDNNEMYQKDNKNNSSFDSNAKLHYALDKHYNLKELDDEVKIYFGDRYFSYIFVPVPFLTCSFSYKQIKLLLVFLF